MKTTIISINLFVIILLFISSCSSEKENIPKDSNTIIEEIPKPSEDVVFALDLSISMLAQDFVPNRLEAVKSMLRKMIREKENQQQMSIVIFAGEAMVLCPLTKDSSILLDKVKLIEVNKIENGTAIGMGMMYGLYELSKSNSVKKDILVLTDGVNNNDEYSYTLAAKIARQQKIQIHSFGIGCTATALTPVAQRPNGTFVFDKSIVQIDETILKSVGGQTKGNYLRVTCSSDLESLQSLKSLLSKSNSKPDNVKLDTIPNQKIDSLWKEIGLKNQLVMEKFSTPKKRDTIPVQEVSKNLLKAK